MVEIKELTSTEFGDFQKFIYELSGIFTPDSKRTLLSNRIRRRLRAGGFENYQSYYTHLKSADGQRERMFFLDAVTTNETFFFRTQKHFDWFHTKFIREKIQQARGGQRQQTLRIWSAACSTGEEPYSLAICLAENQFQLRGWKLEIVATDLSSVALQSARGETIDVRGEFIHLVRMDRVFYWRKTDCGNSRIDGTSKDDDLLDHVNVVILHVAGRTIGLCVEELCGSSDIVIKSLSENFVEIQGLSGASIMGDGSVCLMLDTSEVIKMVADRSIAHQPKLSM